MYGLVLTVWKDPNNKGKICFLESMFNLTQADTHSQEGKLWFTHSSHLFLFEEDYWASLVAQMVKNLPALWETWVQSLGREDSLEKGMATHSSILAWRIPCTREAWWVTACGVTKSEDMTKGPTLSLSLFIVGEELSNQEWYPEKKRERELETSMKVQWLRLHVVNAGSEGSTPGWWTKIPHFMWCDQKVKKKKSRKAWKQWSSKQGV